MTSSSAGRRRSATWSRLRGPAVDVGTQVALIGAAWLALELPRGQDTSPAYALPLLVFAAGLTAAVLLCVAGAVENNTRACWLGLAVGVHTGLTLLLRALDIASDGGLGGLAGSVGTLAVVGLLVLSVRRAGDPRAAVGVLVVVLVGAAVVAACGLFAPGRVPPPGLVAGTDLVAWSGAGATGVLLVLAGSATDRPLLRRCGMAFATLAAANALRIIESPAPEGAFEAAAMAMLLLAALQYVGTALRSMRHLRTARGRLLVAEASLAGVAQRDHELRNLVAGLTGAAKALTDDDSGASIDARRLMAAAGTELERLRMLLDGERPPAGPSDVGRVLRDLALVHKAGGADVRVEVDGDPRSAVDAGVLAQAVTNLLVNCAQHAAGARVWLRARLRDGWVRVEVADEGPGLPQHTSALLRRDGRVRPPGMGLAITAELVERHGGTLTVISDGGCRVVLDLPQAPPDAPELAVGA